jgi:hypothetical protein
MSATDLVVTLGVVVTLAAAVRSTWSPCGVSMLASITPLAEAGRGHRYRSTAAWFVAGAVAGGATLGGLMALGALVVRAVGPAPRVVVVTVLVVAVACSASDRGLTARRIPFHRRQVNERWLDGYRPWVYGAGFGWQIGCGLATYIVTAGVYLLVVLGVATGEPRVALALGALFGLVRGLAVLVGRTVTSSASLHALHRRLARLDPVSAAATAAVEATAALVAAAWLVADTAGGRWASAWAHPLPVAGGTALLAAVAASLAMLHRGRRHPAPEASVAAAAGGPPERPEAGRG